MTEITTNSSETAKASIPAAVATPVKTAPGSVKRKAVVKGTSPVVKTNKPTVSPAAKKVSPAAKPTRTLLKKVTPKPTQVIAAAKPAKTKKPKMIRDSMTMPKAEYAVLDALKLRAAKLANPIKKTELLRAGIKALASMSDAGFLVALKAVPSLKTGRPSKS